MNTCHLLTTKATKPEASAPPARLCLTLPYPPSVNHYWRRRGAAYFIAKEGQQFRARVCELAQDAGLSAPMLGPLGVQILASAPDRRRRDLDNITKALLDALAHAGIYADDSQVSRLELAWMEPGRGQVSVGVRVLAQRYVPLCLDESVSQ